mgnify:CR=1 FL=1
MGHPNPLRWDCRTDGCFNSKRRPKIDQLARFLPGSCQFGDIDACAEVNGRELRIEWKSAPGPLPKGQEIAFRRLSASSIVTVLCVAGDAETMNVSHVGIWHLGRWTPWGQCDFAGLGRRIERWGAWAKRQPAVVLPHVE